MPRAPAGPSSPVPKFGKGLSAECASNRSFQAAGAYEPWPGRSGAQSYGTPEAAGCGPAPPHPLRTCTFRPDPDFEVKGLLVRLYLNPPEKGLVLCVDVQSGIPTPTPASWANWAECFFSILTRRGPDELGCNQV